MKDKNGIEFRGKNRGGQIMKDKFAEAHIAKLENELEESERIGKKNFDLAIKCGSKLAQIGLLIGLKSSISGYDMVDSIVPAVKNELENRKPKAKRLVWSDDYKCSRAKLSDSWYLKISLGISEADIYLVKKDKDTGTILHSTGVVYIPNNVNRGDINAFEKPKSKAQEWLDRLVEDCAEFCDSSTDNKNICIKQNAEKLDTNSEDK